MGWQSSQVAMHCLGSSMNAIDTLSLQEERVRLVVGVLVSALPLTIPLNSP